MNNIKVGVKLVAGFLIVAAIAAVIGIVGVSDARRLDHYNNELYSRRIVLTNELGNIALNTALMRLVLRTVQTADDEELKLQIGRYEKCKSDFLASIDVADKLLLSEDAKEHLKELHKNFEDYTRDVQTVIDSTPKYRVSVPPEYKKLQDDARVSSSAITKSADAIVATNAAQSKELWESSTKTYNEIRVALITLVIVGFLLGAALGYILSVSISKQLEKTVHMLDDLRHGHLGIRLRMSRGDEIGIMADTMDKFADDLQHVVVGTMKQISDGDLSAQITPHDDKDEIGPALMRTIESLRALIIDDGGRVLHAAAGKDLSQRLEREYKGEYAMMKESIDTVVKSLDDAMSQVSEAVRQVSSASGQISQGAQSLAEGANEQASSLEEISSSLEEMSSMTKQNADNSNQGKAMVASAAESLNAADAAMKRMAGAIQEIKTSSDNTAKILKTIDDIAFQTNLLALNAAVEAARAGDAGKGFAVVAGEVRNLAMRSADAAKNTANMIEESVKSANEGVQITEDVAKYLSTTVERAGKVAEIIGEVAAASNEQALGIEQVNTAVAQMNQVTQQNAANSEESASAAEELSSQAAELANMVSTFTLSSSDHRAPKTTGKMNAVPSGGGGSNTQARMPVIVAGTKKTQTRMPAVASGPATKAIRAVKADDIIPLGDDDMADF